MLWCRWRYGGDDPFDLFHNGIPSGRPDPQRHRALIDGFALYAHEMTMRAAGAKEA